MRDKIDVLEPGWVRNSNNSPSEKILRTRTINAYNSVMNEGHSTKGRYVKQFCIIYHDFSVKLRMIKVASDCSFSFNNVWCFLFVCFNLCAQLEHIGTLLVTTSVLGFDPNH